MKTIISTAAIFVSSIMLASADVVAKSHEEVGRQNAALMTEMIAGVASITDIESANAYVATLAATKEKLKALLEAAKALPAPSEAERTAVNKMMDEARTNAEPVMKAAMMGLAQNPEAETIGLIIGPAMTDDEFSKLGKEIEAIYE